MTDLKNYMYTNIPERARWLIGCATDEGSKAASGISGEFVTPGSRLIINTDISTEVGLSVDHQQEWLFAPFSRPARSTPAILSVY
ncbi:MAG: hypothetical protein AAF225_10715 [Pseudomonadota bacterium]